MTMQSYPWSPIVPLEETLSSDVLFDLARLDATRRIWDQTRNELDPEVRESFTSRLNRSIAVETGIIEGLYELDRGLTQTLVTHGFARDAVDRAGESVPESTLSMLRDHLRGLDFIMDYIGEMQRDLSTSYIREIHALVTASQRNSNAIDQFGNYVEIEMLRGEYKQQPNNPLTPRGGLHEYAPVEQVAVQMDELVRLFRDSDEDQHPVVKAAWLHHRFVQIHPFQDGNGRVARLLASMVLIKGGYFPLHIRREDRPDYLDALEEADAGRLEPLVKLMTRRLREDCLRAVSDAAIAAVERMPADGDGTSRTLDVAALIAERRQRHQAEILEQRRHVNQVAEECVLPHLVATLETRIGEAKAEFEKRQVHFDGWTKSGGAHDGRGYYWWYQIVQTAREHKYWANQSENRYWIRSDLNLDEDRLTMVVSLHHYGWPVSGIMAISAFVQVRHSLSEHEDDEGDGGRHLADRELVPCIDRVFTFTEDDAGEQLLSNLDAWIDEALAVTLRILATSGS